MRHPPISFVILSTVLLTACDDGRYPVEPDRFPGVDRPALAISDGAHGGNEHFFFLPPLVRPLDDDLVLGVFDVSVLPVLVVEVCEWTGAACVPPLLARFTSDQGTGGEVIEVRDVDGDAYYQVKWTTKEANLDPDKTYRVSVLAGSVELGHADVDVVTSGEERKAVDPSQFVALRSGATLPIKFRVEEGAVVTPLTWTLETINSTSNLLSVWASSPSDVWVGGGYRTLLHFDGSSWSQPSLPTGTQNTNSVYGFTSTAVFAAGQAGVLRYDGVSWSFALGGVGELFGIWGTSPTDLFVSGDGRFLHFDGANWTDIPTGLSTAFNTDRILALWGTSSTNVFMAVASRGPSGRIMHYDGSTVTEVLTVPGTPLHAIHGTGEDDVFAVGAGGRIWHFDGTAWSEMVSPTSQSLGGVFAVSSNDVYAAGTNGALLHYDGVSWSSLTSGTDLFLGGIGYGVFALSPDLVLVTAAPGALLVGRR